MTTIDHQPDVATWPEGAVTGRPRWILRAEGGVLLAAALVGFGTTSAMVDGAGAAARARPAHGGVPALG